MQPGSFEQYLTNLACLVYIARDTDNTKIGQGDEYMTTMWPRQMLLFLYV